MEQLEPGYLLIVGCSQRKRCAEGKIPALERYDGPMFRMLRKFQHDFRLPSGLKILILSAHYGLIQADKPISNYDLRMTRNQAALLFPEVTHSLEALSQLPIAEAYIDLGRCYQTAMPADLSQMLPGISIRYGNGGIGQRVSRVKRWLRSIT